ncbi:MAG TPA: TonB-dependent receptor [Hyphomonadaceae bacterium]|nr:TonB-dependent receptor [Hyphomonadaceae bacterium]
MNRAKYHLFASLLALGVAMPALAQPAVAQAEPQATPDPDRDVVVVTANKREETVQDIAVAVTAVTAEKKEELGIISVTDLTNVTPGLSYTPGNERVTLRGIGRLSNSFGADPGVANYNDGIYTPFAVFAGKDPILIDRVEVLRGPQGTLYGRNAIGGAINTISKRPTDDFRTDFEFGIGNFGDKKMGAAVSGPINDSLRYRVAGQIEKRDGIDHNYGTNSDEGWEIDDKWIEGQLAGNFGDRFKWWLKVADASYDKAGPPGGRTATFSTAPFLNGMFSTGGLNPNDAFAYGNPSVISYTQGGTRTDNPFATNGEHAYNSNYESTAKVPNYDEAIFEAVYSLDNFDIKYTGGYTYYKYFLTSDGDGTPIDSITYTSVTGIAPITACSSAAGLRGGPLSQATAAGAGACVTSTAPRTIYPGVLNLYEESRALFSNEVNLISTGSGPLQWIVGAYQYQENSDQPGQVQTLPDEPIADTYFDTTLGVVANPQRLLQEFRNVSLFNAYGLYGQVDYSFTDQWKATLGLRYSKDIKDSKEEAFLACYIICQGALGPTQIPYFNYTRTAYGDPALGATFDDRGFAERRLHGSYNAVTGTAGVEYRPINDTLLFAKYSRGYKAGGFNNLGFGLNPYTDPEFVDSYEGGWKQTFRDWGLTLDAALFYYKYHDMQAPLTVITGQQGQTGSTTFTAFVNVPEAESKGFELEGNWNPIDPLNIGFSYAYLDATVTDTNGASYVDVSRDPRCVNPANPTGAPITCSTTATTLVDPLRNKNVVGNQLSQSPKNKFSINASYKFDFQDGSYLLPTITYSWRDKFYDTFFNDPNELSPSYDQVDARLNWYSADGFWQVTGWVRNLTDEEQNTSISSNSYRIQDNGAYQTLSFTPPRMFGIDLLFHYR